MWIGPGPATDRGSAAGSITTDPNPSEATVTRPVDRRRRRRTDGDHGVERQRHRQREAVVVVGVFADQVDPSGRPHDELGLAPSRSMMRRSRPFRCGVVSARAECTGRSRCGSLARPATVSVVDVRIGVTQAPREISLEVDDAERDDVKARVEAALVGRHRRVVDHRQAWARTSACRPPRSPTSRSGPPTATAASDSGADARRGRRVDPRPTARLRHRQGWCRQDLGRRRAGPAGGRPWHAHARLRDGCQGLARRRLRCRPAGVPSRASSSRTCSRWR